jgi:hypothetical protein
METAKGVAEQEIRARLGVRPAGKPIARAEDGGAQLAGTINLATTVRPPYTG